MSVHIEAEVVHVMGEKVRTEVVPGIGESVDVGGRHEDALHDAEPVAACIVCNVKDAVCRVLRSVLALVAGFVKIGCKLLSQVVPGCGGRVPVCQWVVAWGVRICEASYECVLLIPGEVIECVGVVTGRTQCSRISCTV